MFKVDQVPDALGYYFAGFVDGEGSFHLTFRRRPDYKLPWKVSLCLNVSQKDRVILALLKRHLQCGTIRYKGDDVWMFEVNNLNAIRENVIPFFKPIRLSLGQEETRLCDLRANGRDDGRRLAPQQARHRRLVGLRREMNDGGKRKYSEESILAAFETTESPETIRRTSAVQSAAEDDIVRSAGRPAEPGGNARSSG